MKRYRVLGAVLLSLMLQGCATTYQTPGGAVSIPEITEESVAAVLAREPAATFPARLIVARVQAPGYSSYTNDSYGRGKYSVVTARDVETDEDFSRLGAMPGVAGVGTLSRVLLADDLGSTKELREAAAQLRGDVLLVYTFDTSFRTEEEQIGPLKLVSLGFFPNKKSYVTTTCAAAFIDVRTGYVYGVTEAQAREDQRTGSWGEVSAIERARAKAERDSFGQALAEIEKLWLQIYAERGTESKPAAK